MHRFLLVLIVCSGSVATAQAADVFDLHTSKWLRKGIEKQKPLAGFSIKDAGRLKTLSPDISNQCIVVTTNDGNITKALIGWGYRRGQDGLIPVLVLERFVTYRGNGSNSAAARGKNIMLFAGFAFNFDIGQVVPVGQGEDVRFTAKKQLEPVGKARLFGLDGSQLPAKKKGVVPDPLDHDGVLPRDFTGTWKMTVDGRWKGELRIVVNDAGRATGEYTSAESKSTYKVTGRITALKHNLKLNILLDNTTQTIDAFIFTESKSTLSGTSTLARRKFGFHATRRVTKTRKP